MLRGNAVCSKPEALKCKIIVICDTNILLNCSNSEEKKPVKVKKINNSVLANIKDKKEENT